MHLGVFAKVFPRPTFEESLDAIADRGLTHVQFNMSCTGQPTLPDRHDQNHCIWIARSFRERGLTMAAISGTFNLCDPDPSRLADNLRRLELLAGACRWLDTRIITLCTGTRDPEDMWKWHPDNASKATWDVLLESMRQAVRIADRHEVTLAFEPELNNVVNTVRKARMLLDEIGSPWLKIVIDPANLMRADDRQRLGAILDEAFDWLGPEIVLAHAKNPEMTRSPEETITIAEYRKVKDPRAPDLPIVEEMLHAAGQQRRPPAGPEPSREALEQAPREIRAARYEALAARFPRYLADLQAFYGAYLDRLRSINYAGALTIHGVPEEGIAPLQAMIADLLQQ